MASQVEETKTIFARDKKGNLKGLISKEHCKGWILRLGYDRGAAGHHPTLLRCMEASMEYYDFYVAEDINA